MGMRGLTKGCAGTAEGGNGGRRGLVGTGAADGGIGLEVDANVEDFLVELDRLVHVPGERCDAVDSRDALGHGWQDERDSDGWRLGVGRLLFSTLSRRAGRPEEEEW